MGLRVVGAVGSCGAGIARGVVPRGAVRGVLAGRVWDWMFGCVWVRALDLGLLGVSGCCRSRESAVWVRSRGGRGGRWAGSQLHEAVVVGRSVAGQRTMGLSGGYRTEQSTPGTIAQLGSLDPRCFGLVFPSRSSMISNRMIT